MKKGTIKNRIPKKRNIQHISNLKGNIRIFELNCTNKIKENDATQNLNIRTNNDRIGNSSICVYS